jgi:hypothetical protein
MKSIKVQRKFQRTDTLKKICNPQNLRFHLLFAIKMGLVKYTVQEDS